MSTRHHRTKKKSHLVFVMVGLPARGKSFISRRLEQFLSWKGHPTRVFNVGKYRREAVEVTSSGKSDFFDPNNESAKAQREAVARAALNDMLQWMMREGEIGIFDATNSTEERRQLIIRVCKSSPLDLGICFIETLCTNQDVLEENMRCKVAGSPDFFGMSEEEAIADLRARIAKYEAVYETIAEGSDYSYIKLWNMSSQVFVSGCYGRVAQSILPYLMAVHIGPRPIWLVRAGEGVGLRTSNTHSSIGSPLAQLTESGKAFSEVLADYIRDQLTAFQEVDGDPLAVQRRYTRSGHQDDFFAVVQAAVEAHRREMGRDPETGGPCESELDRASGTATHRSTGGGGEGSRYMPFGMPPTSEEGELPAAGALSPSCPGSASASSLAAIKSAQASPFRRSSLDTSLPTGDSFKLAGDSADGQEGRPPTISASGSLPKDYGSALSPSEFKDAEAGMLVGSLPSPGPLETSRQTSTTDPDQFSFEDALARRSSTLSTTPQGGREWAEKDSKLRRSRRLTNKWQASVVRNANGLVNPGAQLKVITSTLPRAAATISRLKTPHSREEYFMLTPLDKGEHMGRTMDEIAEHDPKWYQRFTQDVYNTRFPGGECYRDLMNRLESVLIEIEQQTMPVLVVSHVSVLQVLLCYFLNRPVSEAPEIEVPLHTVIELQPTVGGPYLETRTPLLPPAEGGAPGGMTRNDSSLMEFGRVAGGTSSEDGSAHARNPSPWSHVRGLQASNVVSMSDLQALGGGTSDNSNQGSHDDLTKVE